MDAPTELEWTSAIQGLLLEPEAHVDETYRKTQYSARQCPHCASYTLLRRPLPNHLRFLRRFGIDFRNYNCESCKKGAILRHR